MMDGLAHTIIFKNCVEYSAPIKEQYYWKFYSNLVTLDGCDT